MQINDSGSRVLVLKEKRWSLPQVLVHCLVPLKAELHLHCSGFVTVRADDYENISNREKFQEEVHGL
jgi:hypothetical protein